MPDEPRDLSIPFANLELHLEKIPEPVDEEAEIQRLLAKFKEARGD